MLKIIDNFDLDDLKKFGFEKDGYSYKRRIDNNWWKLIEVSSKNREICELKEVVGWWEVTFSDEEFWDNSWIKDLWDANIVEVIDDE